jgi:hypothetical protein
VSPVPVKFMVAVAVPFVNVWFDTGFTTGGTFIVPVIGTFEFTVPETNVTFPEILPVGAEAPERTYTTVLLTAPPDNGSVTLFPNPLPAESDTSKLFGAVATMSADRSPPETINCWILGLAEAVPAQAEIMPLAWLVMMVGTVGVGFTVMVNVTGLLPQPVPPVTKLPNESGYEPTEWLTLSYWLRY